MKLFGQILFSLFVYCFAYESHAIMATPDFPDKGVMEPSNRGFIDPGVDYEKFFGRVSDKDKSGRILKIKVENNNTKFLKAGDTVYFKVNQHDSDIPCRATVRSIDDFYFVIYVQEFKYCWDTSKYFPRGMQLNFEARVMGQRVFEASKYREILLLRKEGYLKQLNGINNFLWTYDQQKMKTASDYDIQINELRKQKRLAIDNLLQTKQENLMLQLELQKKLDTVDEALDHYRVERQEFLTDRWDLDHDTGLPFSQRPPKMKNR